MANKRQIQAIKLRREFEHLRLAGSKVRPSRWLLINFKDNEYEITRCGWTVPRYVGPAVIRNRLKRWGREVAKKMVQEFAENSVPKRDLNFVFLKQEPGFYKNLKYDVFAEVFSKGWKMATLQRRETRRHNPKSLNDE